MCNSIENDFAATIAENNDPSDQPDLSVSSVRSASGDLVV